MPIARIATAITLCFPLMATAGESLDDKNLPDRETVETLCTLLEEPESRERVLENQDGIRDINNNGQEEVWESYYCGTMNVPCVRFYDQAGQQVTIRKVGYEWKDYWTFGVSRFRYQGGTYSLHSRDDHGELLSHVSYATPENRKYVLCEFSREKPMELVEAAPSASSFCEAVPDDKEAFETVEFSESVELDGDPFHTYPRGMTYLDFNNDGGITPVMAVDLSSGAGRGCTFRYFKPLTQDHSEVATGPLHDQLKELHGLDEVWPGRCGYTTRNRFFVHEGITYFHRNYESNPYLDQEVRVMQGGELKTVCRYEYTNPNRLTWIR